MPYTPPADTMVNGGALQMVLNMLKRGTPVQQEAALELMKTVTQPALVGYVDPAALKELGCSNGMSVWVESAFAWQDRPPDSANATGFVAIYR